MRTIGFLFEKSNQFGLCNSFWSYMEGSLGSKGVGIRVEGGGITGQDILRTNQP